MALEGDAAGEIGPAAAELSQFNAAARKMMYNDTVTEAFRFTTEETRLTAAPTASRAPASRRGIC
jgi:hypothetical protein